MTNNKGITIALIILVGVLVQVALIVADGNKAPYEVAADFAKVYYKLDENMTKYLCSTMDGKEEMVEKYIYKQTQEGRERGFAKSFMKSRLLHIETKTDLVSDTEAWVHLTAKKRVSISPFFAWVAQIFQMGKTDHVDETYHMIKEAGTWKICGQPFASAPV